MAIQFKTAAFVLVMAGIAAGSAPAAQQTGRYTLKQTQSGFIRLDTETGSVAHCSQSNDKWHCESLNDDASDSNNEIARLKEQNRQLKRSITRLEAKLSELSTKGAKPRSKLELPSDQELDEIMGFFEKMVTRLMQFARTLQGAPGEDI